MPPPDETLPPSPRSFEELGALVEAMELAQRLVQIGPGKSLTAKLQEDVGVSKDYYYRRTREFTRITGVDFNDLVEAEIERRVSGTPHPDTDLFEWYEAIQRFNEAVLDSSMRRLGDSENRLPRVRLRVGVIEHLTQSLVAPVMRKFRLVDGFDEQRVRVHFELGMSGELFRMFQSERLDLFVSRCPPDIPPHYEKIFEGDLDFAFVCPHEHPVARRARECGGPTDPIDLKQLAHTALVLIGPNPRRSTQFSFPRDRLRELVPSLQIIEVDAFKKAHDLISCGRTDIAAITIPEFLEEERFRGLAVIEAQRFSNLPPINPLRLCMLKQKAERGQSAERDRALTVLRDRLLEGLRDITEGSAEFREIADWLGPERHVYYERTRAGGPDQSQGGLRGWAHSVIRWKVLNSGIVIGQHLADLDRSPDGTSRGYKASFNIVGQLVRNSKNPDEWQLLWSAVDQNEELYSASFIISPKTIRALRDPGRRRADPDRDIVGIWTGRRTSGESFQPSVGYIVISMHPPDWQIRQEANTESQKKEILDHLTGVVRQHEVQFPGWRYGGLAQQWEWEAASDSRGRDPHESALDSLLLRLNQLDDLKPELQRLVEKLQPPKPEVPTQKPKRASRGQARKPNDT